MNALRIHVEKIVRPLAASRRRKDGMRQELHAHLIAAFEEELQRVGDERLAIKNTLERLGDVAELRQQLQSTVPMLESLLMRDVWLPGLGRMERRVGETPLHHAVRISLFSYSCSFGFALVFCSVAIPVRLAIGQHPKLDQIARFALPMFGTLLVLQVAFPILADRMRKAICAGFAPSRSFPLAALWGTIASVLTFAAGVTAAGAFNLSARGEFFREFHTIRIPLVCITAAMPFLLALYAALSAREIRRFDEDASRMLEISE
jgi:hypothetical protein